MKVFNRYPFISESFLLEINILVKKVLEKLIESLKSETVSIVKLFGDQIQIYLSF